MSASIRLTPVSKVRINLTEQEYNLAILIQELQPIILKELHEKFNERYSTNVTLQNIQHLVKRLEEKEVVVTEHGEGTTKNIYIAEGIELSDGAAFKKAPIVSDPTQQMERLLEMFDIPVKLRKNILELITLKPDYLQYPNELFNLLITLKVEAKAARQITDTYFQLYGRQYESANMPYYPNPPMQPYPAMQPYPYPSPSFMPATVGYMPDGRPIIVMQPQSQPQPQQQQQPQQPIIIKTGETRKIRRIKRDEKGNPLKLPDGSYEYEEIEEPVTLVANSQENSLTATLLNHLLEKKNTEPDSKYEKEIQELKNKLEDERIKRYEEQVNKIREDTNNMISGVLRQMQEIMQKQNENLQTVLKEMHRSWEDRWKDFEHKQELERVRAESSAGERPLVTVVKNLTQAVKEMPLNFAEAYRTVVAPNIQLMDQNQIANDAKRLRDELLQQ
jgi:polyhydroxyalkanoate synthesis regulator protein